MYNERKDGFTIKDIVLQILFIALFIFILIWLFPMKSDLDKAVSDMVQFLKEAYPNKF